MARKLDGSYITANTITTTQLTTTVVNQISAGGGPKVTTITYPNSTTAAVNTGNESVVLTGTGFDAGVQVYINGAAAPSVSRTNSTSLSFTTPALTTGTTYPLYVVNPDGGTAVVVPGMVVSAGPVWVTASPLTSWGASSALSTTLVATSDSTISYALAAGSSLPSGITLAANGLLSGTLTSPPGVQTTYNFTVTATDLELQKSSKAFSINATIGIEATGGTVSNIAGYRVHTFTSSGTFQVTSGSGSAEYLVVAGGGGGGGSRGAGGGAGGFRTGTLSISAQSYAITVGAGGSGATNPSFSSDPATMGSNGSASIFSTITSAGGGGGAVGWAGFNVTGRSGGSGGGGGDGYGGGAGNIPATSPSQGNNGGGNAPNGGGGGGGAGGVGADGVGAPTPSVGGAGAASPISGSPVTYAGGGGGYTPGASPAAGGSGGGATQPAAGTANRGGGGAGGSSGGTGTNGGSGIVIIRYAA